MTLLETEAMSLLEDIFFEGCVTFDHLDMWVSILEYAVEDGLLGPAALKRARALQADYE